ncbi:hypothetical protein [Luteolibacter marinus]|uniref:hypothetical protein n=1 Tax=Luteolibacter marinus TaxID=2776705 RepID=UPI001865F1E6|nr:hypothetical protein [Luteolibacter marinus]
MKPKSPSSRFALIGAVVSLAASAIPGRAEEMVRYVLLQVPAKEGALIHSRLEKAKPEAMDEILQRPGIGMLGDFMEVNPWRGETVEMSMPMDPIEFGGEVAKERGVKLEVEGARIAAKGVVARLAAEVDLPEDSKGYRSFHSHGSIPVRPGTWREDARWGDGKETLMLWRLATTTAPEDEAAAGDPVGKVEMLWFKLPEADLGTLAKSKPETRDKAFEWLTGRGELWKESSFWVRGGERSAWMMAEGKLSLAKDQAVADESRAGFDVEIRVDGDTVKFAWNIFAKEQGSDDEAKTKFVATATPGVWEFSEIKGIDGANVVAWRCAME